MIFIFSTSKKYKMEKERGDHISRPRICAGAQILKLSLILKDKDTSLCGRPMAAPTTIYLGADKIGTRGTDKSVPYEQ